ncbi:uncharacterized protein LOC111701093 isoform X2 [Eurytemora carolleeae]|uniref:uncharacterized protein LOC111701093 isoform X2 n=1 Tax=Eurytemora carolleeae TaxID=1294199 RepID=UPI000C790725|nr:uncharacterized protein LOC111701093 isoform X2 [Eurytemora carolleeae]|eukprot:XP_023328007.1 uncharacterized protein LOC111701093 isoform X2 [Eurytemora affinis]
MDVNLGYMDGNRYRLHDGSLWKLKKLNSALDSDIDLTLRSRILREKVLDNQIIQALVHLRPEIDLVMLEEIIQILCKLTAQIDMGEMLEPVTEQLYSEHKLYLSQVKDVFNEPKFTWPILKLLKLYISELDKNENEKKIEDCLVLVQNLLSISEHYAGTMAAAVIANLQCRTALEK